MTLMIEVSNLLDNKAKLEIEVIHYMSLLTDKDNQLLTMTIELENTKKSLKTINCGTRNSKYILSISKSSSNHHRIIYQHGEDSNYQGAFVKASPPIALPLTTSPPIAKISYCHKGKVVAHSSKVHQDRINRFIPTCHFPELNDI